MSGLLTRRERAGSAGQGDAAVYRPAAWIRVQGTAPSPRRRHGDDSKLYESLSDRWLDEGVVAVIAAGCCSCCRCRPPPNAIVYSSGMLPITRMVKTGAVFDVIGVILCVVGVAVMAKVVGLA